MQPRHILVFGVGRSLTNFRGPLIRAMLAAGHRVTAVGDEHHDDMAATLAAWGAEFRTVRMARAGMNPFGDLATVAALTRLMRGVRPDVFFGYTIKASALGVLAAWLAGVRKRVAMIAGLGYAFTEGNGTARRVARLGAETLCRVSFRLADKVIFQNPDDLNFFVDRGLVSRRQVLRVEGSGIDLDHFGLAPLPAAPLTFLMLSRLLGDKGVREFAAAARQVKQAHPEVRFLLAGDTDANPASVTRTEIAGWAAEGTLDWLGHVSDVRTAIAEAHVGVLPSYYREGVPRSLLEMMAMGRALITTDAPGCRETVNDGANGFLVPPRDADALAAAMLKLVRNPSLVARFGAESRRIAAIRFDVNSVNRAMLDAFGLTEGAPTVVQEIPPAVAAVGAAR